MATKKQKQELVEILKFTPRTYRIELGPYGGECYMGVVDRKIYDFFKQHKIDMEEYATEWDDKFAFVPDDMRPFPPGSPFECDSMCHASGPEMSDSNTIEVYDENNNRVWEGNMSLDWLDDEGIEVHEWETTTINDQPEGTVVFWGGQGEKGLLFGGEIELKQPFDPKKLKLQYSNCDGWLICNGVSYDGEDLENNDYSSTGKWGENKWVIVGDEEVYEGVSRDDVDEEPAEDDNDTYETPSMPELPKTDWYTADVKPVYKGEYEVDLGSLIEWPFSRIVQAEWTGRGWKALGGAKVNIEAWRGLAFDPNMNYD